MDAKVKKGKKLKGQTETAKHIEHLLKSLGDIKQFQLAEKLDVTQPMVSAWMSGREEPSAAFLFRLGSLASYPESLWFWERAGIGEQAVIDAAKGINEGRRASSADLAEKGDVVLVPRFRETRNGRKDAGLPVAVPREFVPHPDQTITLIVDQDATGISDAPRGLYIVDTLAAGTRNVVAYQERVVVTYIPDRERAPSGVVIGRLRLASQTHQLRPMEHWMSVYLESLVQRSTAERLGIPSWSAPLRDDFDRYHKLGVYGKPLRVSEGEDLDQEALMQRIDEAWLSVGRDFPLDEGVRIIGEVIGRLTGHIDQESK